MEKLSDGKILIVDDTEMFRLVLVGALENDYKVSVAVDGESALQSVEDDKPDLILLDIMMPGLDGYQVCNRIKNDPATKDIIVIFVTSVEEALQRNLGFQVGCADYLNKPFETLEVQKKVKSYLSLALLQKENALLKQKLDDFKSK